MEKYVHSLHDHNGITPVHRYNRASMDAVVRNIPDFDTIYYVIEWVIRLVALVVVPMRRPAAAARAWLLLIFFLPIPGTIIFLLIGRPKFPAERTRMFRAVEPWVRTLAERLRPHAPSMTTDKGAIATLGETCGYLPATAGNRIELIDDYDQVVERLVADIDSAISHVEILVYIFADDHVGQSVAEAMARAVERGVRCRVILDPVGSRQWVRGAERMLKRAGVDVVEALPFRFFRERTRRDMRNHRKLFVIDGRIGYAGSQNLVARDFRPKIVNRELVARVEGPVVAEMESVIETDWHLETRRPMAEQPFIPDACGDGVAQLLPTGADYRHQGFHELLVWQINAARKRVILTTPYFIPDTSLMMAVRTAVARGVDVRLVLSAAVDQPLIVYAQRSYYDDLLSAGVHVHLYRDYLLHAKNVSIDGRFAIVGSSNIDIRSFQLNEEVNLLLYDDASVSSVVRVQEGYLASSDALVLSEWRQRPLHRKVAENMARMVDSLF